MSSKEFEQLQKIINPPPIPEDEVAIRNRALEQINEQNAMNEKVKENLKSIIDDESILEKSGIESLFTEISDSDLVRYSSEPMFEGGVQGFKRGFLGIETFGYIEKRKIKEYQPAKVWKCDLKSDIEEVLDYNSNSGKVFISLIFNYHIDYPDMDRFSEVRVAVVNNKLNLVQEGDWYDKSYKYTPIEDGKLIETIAGAIKNPPIKEDGIPHESYGLRGMTYETRQIVR